MIFSKVHIENQEFWNKNDIPTFDQEDFQNVQVLMGNFTKVGRTFKQRCVRTYFMVKQFLLYSDVGSGNRIKGFVQLDTVYCEFPKSESGYSIHLTNNGFQINLNTEDKQQYEIWMEALSNCCILSDFEKTYRLGNQIGQGSFSTVYKCYNKDGDIFAVKVIKKQSIKLSKNRSYEEQLLNEIQTLRMFNHPNILKLLRVYENQSSICLLTEYVDGPELVSQQASKKVYSADELRIMILSILGAVEQIHQQRVMHRDIKPQNILLNMNDITKPVIIDFGLAAYTCQKSIPFPQCGSPGYSAPEVLKYEESKKIYNQQCDIFSLGITLFVILYGYNPFKSNDLKQTIKKNTEAYFEIPQSKYPKTQNLICLMTKKYPKDRITINEAMNHPFFKTQFFCQLSLPKQIISKQYHDIIAKGETNVHINASMDMDQGVNYVSLANTQTTPQNVANKNRTISILSVGLSRKSQELKFQDISSQFNNSRTSNEKDSNPLTIRHPSKTLPQEQRFFQEFDDEYQLNNIDHDINSVDEEHLHKLQFSINQKLFQTTSKLKNEN